MRPPTLAPTPRRSAAANPDPGAARMPGRNDRLPSNLLRPGMTSAETPPTPSVASSDAPRPSWREAFAVYLQPRVLIVLFLGFSSGLPLALSGSTLLVWMRESGVDLGTIGLFALVGTPYTQKYIWAPLVDALHVPVLSRLFGRRGGWHTITIETRISV